MPEKTCNNVTLTGYSQLTSNFHALINESLGPQDYERRYYAGVDPEIEKGGGGTHGDW